MKPLEHAERHFRKLISYPAMRLLFRNRVISSALDLQGARSILVLRYDRIGDMIVTLPVLKALKRRNPSCTIAVLAGRSNAELVRDASYVDEYYVLERRWLNLILQILRLRRRRFDVVLNFIFNRTTGPAILANLIAPAGLKIGQGPERYATYFNRVLKLPRFERPMTEQLAVFVSETFGLQIPSEELVQGIEVTEDQRSAVDAWLRRNRLKRQSEGASVGRPYVVFNLSAQGVDRKITPLQANAVAACLLKMSDVSAVLVHAPDDDVMRAATKEQGSLNACLTFETGKTSPLHELASLIGGAAAVVSPETSVVHFAAGMGTPVFGIYGEHHGTEWKPYGGVHAIIESQTGTPASSIEPQLITESLEEFLHGLRIVSEEKGRE